MQTSDVGHEIEVITLVPRVAAVHRVPFQLKRFDPVVVGAPPATHWVELAHEIVVSRSVETMVPADHVTPLQA